MHTAQPKSTRINVRVTALEKKDWREAAGGERLVSEWLRRLANAECELLRRAELPKQTLAASQDLASEEASSSPAPMATVAGGVTLGEPAPPLERPLAQEADVTEVGSSAAGNISDEAADGSRASRADEAAELLALAKTIRVPEVVEHDQQGKTQHCPRWTSHRPGTYCGTCKTVTPR